MPGGAQPVPAQVPDWAMVKNPVTMPEGVLPPAFGLTAQAGLTEPDKAGNQWVLLQVGDGTVSITLRMAWQNAPQFGVAIAQMVAQVSQQAAALAGPQLIVPPAGTTLPNLGINGNGKRA